MTEENKAETPKTKKPRKAAPKKAKKESTRMGKMTDAQVDRFVAQYAKERDMTVKAAERAIMVRGAQRLATLSRWQDKQESGK